MLFSGDLELSSNSLTDLSSIHTAENLWIDHKRGKIILFTVGTVFASVTSNIVVSIFDLDWTNKQTYTVSNTDYRSEFRSFVNKQLYDYNTGVIYACARASDAITATTSTTGYSSALISFSIDFTTLSNSTINCIGLLPDVGTNFRAIVSFDLTTNIIKYLENISYIEFNVNTQTVTDTISLPNLGSNISYVVLDYDKEAGIIVAFGASSSVRRIYLYRIDVNAGTFTQSSNFLDGWMRVASASKVEDNLIKVYYKTNIANFQYSVFDNNLNDLSGTYEFPKVSNSIAYSRNEAYTISAKRYADNVSLQQGSNYRLLI